MSRPASKVADKNNTKLQRHRKFRVSWHSHTSTHLDPAQGQGRKVSQVDKNSKDARSDVSGDRKVTLKGRRTGSYKERPTYDEHSLASVELASWKSRGTSRRGSFLPFSFASFLSPVDAAKKAEVLETVQSAIVKLFQRKRLEENELGTLQEHVRTLGDQEAGSLICDYYKDQLLKKGMVILREKIKNEQGTELLQMLGETWDYFFTEILPTLQALLYPLCLKGFDIRNTTLVEFRNIVVLKVSLKEALDAKECEVPPNIRQMLLVLQGLKDDVFLSENQFRCEKLVARVVSPYLGQRGLYEGGPEPVIRATFRPPLPQLVKPPKILDSEDVTHDVPDRVRTLKVDQRRQPLPSPPALRKLHETNHGLQKLKPVLEHVYDMGRRHSFIS
ncbi:proline-rich protein 5-like isoform X3 [Pomacea canaliculata]|nr:proline-rich protein 5-like isoform X3 [Pomacea canaliculata]